MKENLDILFGKLDEDESMFEDCAVWYCPYCDCERHLEFDADGLVECQFCGKEFEVEPVFC